jgi:hypothetical protein
MGGRGEKGVETERREGVKEEKEEESVRMTETERNLFSTPLWLGSTVSGLSC